MPVSGERRHSDRSALTCRWVAIDPCQPQRHGRLIGAVERVNSLGIRTNSAIVLARDPTVPKARPSPRPLPRSPNW